jgi:hypothetical protein
VRSSPVGVGAGHGVLVREAPFLSSIRATIPTIIADEKLVPPVNRYWNAAPLAMSGDEEFPPRRTFL